MTKKVLMLLLVGGAMLSACSSDKKSSGSSSTTATSRATTTVPVFTGDKNSAFCRIGADFNSRFDNLPAALQGSPDNLRSQINALKDVVARAKASAPDPVKNDIGALANVFDQFFSRLEATNYDMRAAASELAKVASPDVQAAAARLQAYGEQVCGIATPSSRP